MGKGMLEAERATSAAFREWEQLSTAEVPQGGFFIRRRRFMTAAYGLTAYRTAVVMNRTGTPGVDWRGSSKGRMADAYAVGWAYGARVREDVIAALEHIDLRIPKRKP